MRLYLVRHGQTQWNKEHRIQGSINELLNDTGREQARALALRLNAIRFEKIYSSPLDRAKETATILNEQLQSEILIETALREASFGSAEGLVRSDYHKQYATRIAEVQQLPFKDRLMAKVIHDGESTYEVASRLISFLESLFQEWMGKNLLIVCHGGVIRSALVSLFSLDDRSISIDNAGYIVLGYKDGCFTLEESHGLKESKPFGEQFTF